MAGKFTNVDSNIMTEKTIVCLYGGPGTGKSTTAAHLFARLKQHSVNAELVPEYIKNWVWEGRNVLPGDQYYIFAKQSRSERIKFKDLDVIVTDSPVNLSVIYERKFEPEPHLCEALVQKHVHLAEQAGFTFKHVFLKRIKKYNPKGRFQSEEEAKQIDLEIKEYLNDYDYIEVTADNDAADNIIKYLGLA